MKQRAVPRFPPPYCKLIKNWAFRRVAHQKTGNAFFKSGFLQVFVEPFTGTAEKKGNRLAADPLLSSGLQPDLQTWPAKRA
ncbi:hypothetical protein ACFP4H_00685 [Pseudophaeobacter arcticus]|uniref:hypothetical protein n=1 Tax=Pseudophaeobacter arcticus TaxID=385492 RepID=UPI000485022F|nr:hypothetical protein [Pseudophaeobacter arcticus]